MFNVDDKVKGGKLEALVERLTQHDTYDASFVQSFLLTFRSFTTSMKLFKLLENRYLIQMPEGLNEQESEEWIKVKRTPIRLRLDIDI